MLVAVASASAMPSSACYYTSYAFDANDKSQTTAYDLLNNRYHDPEGNDKSFYDSELARHERDKKLDDPDWADTYGFLLVRRGRSAEGLAVWQNLIAKDPKRYSTWCNIATAKHNLGKHDEALADLETAIKLRPGFRSGAEEMHVEMIKYQKMLRQDYKSATEHLFVDSLSPFWKSRKPLPVTFQNAEGFPDLNADGLAELLRQYPKFGDGWLALGMVLEHDGLHYLANRAYERAVKQGCAHQVALRDRMRQYTPFAMERDPTRVAGNRIKWAILSLFGAFIAWWAFLMTRRVVMDFTDDKNKAKRKPQKPAK